MLVTRELMAPIGFHCRKKKYTMRVNGCLQLSGYQHSSTYQIHTGLEQLKGVVHF